MSYPRGWTSPCVSPADGRLVWSWRRYGRRLISGGAFYLYDFTRIILAAYELAVKTMLLLLGDRNGPRLLPGKAMVQADRVGIMVGRVIDEAEPGARTA